MANPNIHPQQFYRQNLANQNNFLRPQQEPRPTFYSPDTRISYPQQKQFASQQIQDYHQNQKPLSSKIPNNYSVQIKPGSSMPSYVSIAKRQPEINSRSRNQTFYHNLSSENLNNREYIKAHAPNPTLIVNPSHNHKIEGSVNIHRDNQTSRSIRNQHKNTNYELKIKQNSKTQPELPDNPHGSRLITTEPFRKDLQPQNSLLQRKTTEKESFTDKLMSLKKRTNNSDEYTSNEIINMLKFVSSTKPGDTYQQSSVKYSQMKPYQSDDQSFDQVKRSSNFSSKGQYEFKALRNENKPKNQLSISGAINSKEEVKNGIKQQKMVYQHKKHLSDINVSIGGPANLNLQNDEDQVSCQKMQENVHQQEEPIPKETRFNIQQKKTVTVIQSPEQTRNFKSQLNSFQMKLKDLNDQSVEAQKVKTQLLTKIRNLELNNSQLSQELVASQHKISTLQAKNNSDITDRSQQISRIKAELQKKIQNLEIENTHLHKDLTASKQKVSALQNVKLNDLNERSLEIQKGKIQLEARIHKLELDKTNLSQELSASRHKIHTFQTRQVLLIKQLDSIRNKESMLEAKNNQYVQIIGKLRTEVEKLETSRPNQQQMPTPNFDDALKDQLEQNSKLKHRIEEMIEEIERLHHVISENKRKAEEAINQAAVQKLKYLSELKQIEQKCDITILNKQNEVKSVKHAMETLQGKLIVANNEIKTMDGFLKQYLVGRSKSDEERSLVNQIIGAYRKQFCFDRIGQKILEEQREIEELRYRLSTQ